MNEKVYLILQDGTTYVGRRFGAVGDITAELVFSTSENGYIETLTDPGLYGCALLSTFPISGCYGMIDEDRESSRAWLSAFIVREMCDTPSNFRSQGTLSDYLTQQGVIGVCDIDTRAVTRHLREFGNMNVRISSTPDYDLDELRAFTVRSALKAVSCSSVVEYPSDTKTEYRVAAYDFGLKKSMIKALTARGCSVTVFPYDTDANEIIAKGYNGYLLGGGACSYGERAAAEANIKVLTKTGKPIIALDLGHLLLAESCSMKLNNLLCGHFGANCPVRETSTGRIFITDQGHTKVVDSESVNSDIAEISYINLHDSTVEGLKYKSFPAISFQFHPEANSGPHDTLFVFDEFVKMMEA